jgi:hypothetical protein
MTVDLKQLRIDRSSDKRPSERKPQRGSRKLLGEAALLVVCASGAIFLITRTPAPHVAVVMVHAEKGAGGSGSEVILNATGYIVPAHKIEVGHHRCLDEVPSSHGLVRSKILRRVHRFRWE